MIVIPESRSAALVSHALAFDAIRHALIAAIHPEAASFPVVIAHGSNPQNRFTVKSAAGPGLAGLKVGAYFPTNDARGLPRHASTILLIDQDSGRIAAAIEGSVVNCYRTAAADAVATDALARPDAEVLTIFGTGHQAGYEVEAIGRIRKLRKVLVAGRDPVRAEAFSAKLRSKGIPAEITDAETAVRKADILVTATTATAPLFPADWVRPGTHISSMGSDAPGKQELPPELFTRARLFCDLPEQSAHIGEFQHAGDATAAMAIGAVMSGTTTGRTNAQEITIFDSSGLSLQDLFIGKAILQAAGT